MANTPAMDSVILPIPWGRPLRSRYSPSRLAGIEVLFDFSWSKVFGHDRSAFRHGQSLCDAVKRDCPAGKIPTLILTEIEGTTPRIQEADDRYIVIVPIRDYLSHSGADAASTYYANVHGGEITRLPKLREARFTPQELREFLDENLDATALEDWLVGNSKRRELLEKLLDEPNAQPERLAAIIRQLSSLSDDVLSAFLERLAQLPAEIYVPRVLDSVTQTTEGRLLAANVTAERLSERIQDTRQQLREYQQLIGLPEATETDVQRFLEQHPWILGLPYVRARGRVGIPRGTIDFVLDRYDGFFDIVELKGPREPIIVAHRREGQHERPEPPSTYVVGPALGNALAQAHLYRSILKESQGLRAQFGLEDTRQPRILILIGRATDLSVAAGEVLRELNLSLHRVEIIPYDQLGRRTAGLLDNLQALLGSVQGAT